ncbi:MAG: hypothetical protein KAI16_02045 [Candidatus Pacebacteria bacterium]|nr:hypothetical protein [Candidatus Paceibacterota bacterium]
MTTTKQEIVKYIKKKEKVTPIDIFYVFSISRQMVHRHLKALVEEKVIQKKGTPPKVFYFIKNKEIQKEL